MPDIEFELEMFVENILNKINIPIVIKIIPKISLLESIPLEVLDLILFLAKVSPLSLLFISLLFLQSLEMSSNFQ